MQSKLLNVLPATGKQLLKCCACSEGGRRGMSEQRKGPAGARALVAMHRTTRRGKKLHSILNWNSHRIITFVESTKRTMEDLCVWLWKKNKKFTDYTYISNGFTSYQNRLLQYMLNKRIHVCFWQLTLANQEKSWAMEVGQHWISTSGIWSSAVTRMFSLW